MMERIGKRSIALALVLGVWIPTAWADLAKAVTKAPRPTEAVNPAGCITAECHGEIRNYTVLHGPVDAKTCDACHRLTDVKAHTFQLARQNAELCTFCHEFDTGMLPVVHKPVIAGECLGCHNPHGGTDHGLTREATTAQLCGRCHESMTFGKQFLHDPVSKGDCNSCHRPHASKYPKLLDAVGTNLCLSCHDDFKAQMTKVKFTHKALDEGCTPCHDAHGSNHPKALKEGLLETCLDCHEAIKNTTNAMHQHPAATGERACLTCHTAHGSDLARLMNDQPVRICMNCHNQKIETKEGGTVAAMTEISDPATFKHTPIRDGQCGGCHSTHGSDKPMLLRRDYPTKVKQHFSTEKYDLCFSCHDKRLAEQPQANDQTKFRNGDLNLHFIHVTKGELGRNCRVCHGIHTAKNESLIHDTVQYGNWQMPIRFIKTATGGTCMTGCHADFGYDREKPLASKSAPVPASQTPRVPAADKEEPIIARWTALDIRGNGVSIPANDRPSVLLFLRPDQPQSGQVVKMVAAATPQIGQAQVVVVFSGPQAGEQAKAYAAVKSAGWPIIADTGYTLSAPLGVEAWPATFVTQADGVVVAHVGGAPASLTLELEAYLDLAAKKIDREVLKQRLAQNELLSDGPAKRAVWFLQMGRRLLAETQAEKARTMLADGLKLHPDSVELRLEMVRTLAELKQAGQGMEMLDQLPASALPEWERKLLRGRMLAALGQWDESRRLAEEVLKQMPGHAKAHYLMGMVYEHDLEWEKAAQEYRAASSGGGR